MRTGRLVGQEEREGGRTGALAATRVRSTTNKYNLIAD